MVDRDLVRRKLAELAEYVQAGLMPPDLGHTLVEMTGFRNVIVHEYARIDANLVIRILREHLEDFRRFEAEALRWL